MRSGIGLSLACLVLLTGCIPRVPPPVTIPPELPTGRELAEQQEKLAFSFITYAGEELHGSDAEVEAELVECIRHELASQPLTKDKWELVWGPMVYKFADATLDDNMMFVARRRHYEGQDEDHLVVALRGTNAKAILDWIKEDFEVVHTEGWRWGEPPPGSDPRISRATHNGLEILRTRAPQAGLGVGLTVDRFLSKVVEESKYERLRIDVTGHSLAGALSPTLTLWLKDTQEVWDPDGKAVLAVYAYAGATAGNADFAAYSDSRIGSVTHRIHNPYDIVPMAWNLSTLEALPELYEPVATMPELVELLLDRFLIRLRRSTYTQIRPDQPPIPGGLMSSLTDYAAQAGWQHHYGYLCGLEISDRFNPVSVTCAEDELVVIVVAECPVRPAGNEVDRH